MDLLERCLLCGEGYEASETATVTFHRTPARCCRACLVRGLEIGIRRASDAFLMSNVLQEGEIPTSVRRLIPEELYEKCSARVLELNTIDRTYCCDMRCSAFIPPATIGTDNRASCPKCSKETCALCKSTYHAAPSPCSTEMSEPDKVFHELAETQKYRQCLRCKRWIELIEGCNHMRCLCNAEFCYTCGAQWKTCGCPNMDELEDNNLGDIGDIAEEFRLDDLGD